MNVDVGILVASVPLCLPPGCLAVLGRGAAQVRGIMAKGSSLPAISVLLILIITFTRSGGFAAVPALQVRATVTIDPPQAVVTAEPNYRRELRDDERRQLSEAASAILESGRDIQSATEDGSRDGYQFAFTILSDGRKTTVHASAGSITPGPVRELLEWADHEASAIVRARLKQ